MMGTCAASASQSATPGLADYYVDRKLMWRNVIIIGINNLGWSFAFTIIGPLITLRMLELGIRENIHATRGSINMWALSFLVMYFSWKSDHTVSRLGRRKPYPLVLFPGSPVTASATSEALAAYVKSGGKLLVSGPWPSVNEIGMSLQFLGLPAPQGTAPQTLPLGEGKVLWHPALLAQEEAEHESLQNIQMVASLIGQHAGPAHVQIRPAKTVTWTDWKEGGGHALKTQPRNFGSAVLHRSEKESVLFVLNHYPVAAEFELTFGREKVSQLRDLDTDEMITSVNGKFSVDVDRKSARIFYMVYA